MKTTLHRAFASQFIKQACRNTWQAYLINGLRVTFTHCTRGISWGIARKGYVARLLGRVGMTCLGVVMVATLAYGADFDPVAKSKKKIYFRGWQYKPDIVQDNVERYNKRNKGNIDYATVTHGDYPSLMEKSLIAKDKLDMIYANPPTAVRFLEAGWITPADELPVIDAVKRDMYPNVREAWTHKGKLLGLSYFLTTRGLILVNLEKLRALGIRETSYPKNWDEFYDHIMALHQKGTKDIYLPHWFGAFYGINWAFIWEVLNRGSHLADPKTKRPLATVDGAAGETLRDWKRIWNAGLIPEEVLSYEEAGIVEGFASGRYLYSTQSAYNIAYFNNPENSKIAGSVTFIPYRGQSWGLLDSALYLMTARKRARDLNEDVKRFISWYGYKDNDGKIFVADRWMKSSMLFSAYKSVMESPNTEKSMQDFLARKADYKPLLKVYSETPHPNGIWKVVWSEEINSWLRKRLGNFLLNDESVAEFVSELNKEITRLNKKYKIR